ncbi:ABC transporter permease [Vicingaceae bacterium]|nr:ABC transporter permease [Vicingaceae bacterium]MDC1451720.1 ABC transporter permease [Vicingaceae bacterium]
MNKINLIIQREYLTRVKKKSFLVLSIVGPILFAGLMIVPAWLANEDEDSQNVEVVDETKMFIGQLKNSEEINFGYEFRSLKDAQEDLFNKEGKFTAVLHIPKVVVTHPKTVQLFYKDKPKGSSIDYMENQIARIMEDKKLQDLYNLSYDQVSGLRPTVGIVANKIDETGNSEAKSDKLAMILGLVLAMIIYFFIFLFGVQVMRGVLEEKINRIIEVIISSVKPFELMMGKIIGIAMVALTQVGIWVALSTGIYATAVTVYGDDIAKNQKNQIEQVESSNPVGSELANAANDGSIFLKIKNNVDTINFPLVIGCFIFFFLGGYLLYGSLFAAVGAAVDNETDTQQFMMPITIPLILAIVIAQVVMDNPDGQLAFWGSLFPLTSPILMMVRIPFGVDTWEVALSMGLLIISFIGTTAMAGKIYRIGILMYGKKPSFKEIGKWIVTKT